MKKQKAKRKKLALKQSYCKGRFGGLLRRSKVSAKRCITHVLRRKKSS